MSNFWFDLLMMLLPIGFTMWICWILSGQIDRINEEMNGLRRWCDLLEKQIKMQREKNIPSKKKK